MLLCSRLSALLSLRYIGTASFRFWLSDEDGRWYMIVRGQFFLGQLFMLIIVKIVINLWEEFI